mmetsp:Transcript_12398/g.20098  ORF Transcript_12398/g.20098 Transcript_12398/m.20098 type:complete len:263 (+) Transcript_12398:771-1559(+)
MMGFYAIICASSSFSAASSSSATLCVGTAGSLSTAELAAVVGTVGNSFISSSNPIASSSASSSSSSSSSIPNVIGVEMASSMACWSCCNSAISSCRSATASASKPAVTVCIAVFPCFIASTISLVTAVDSSAIHCCSKFKVAFPILSTSFSYIFFRFKCASAPFLSPFLLFNLACFISASIFFSKKSRRWCRRSIVAFIFEASSTVLDTAGCFAAGGGGPPPPFGLDLSLPIVNALLPSFPTAARIKSRPTNNNCANDQRSN